MKRLRVAIDGPAGAGKSTVAKRVAQRLGILYVDTGAMYRALTLKVIRNHIDFSDRDMVTDLAERTQILLQNSPSGQLVILDGEDVTEEIRTPSVTRAVSVISAIPGVRKHMVVKQRALASRQGVVMDGRDIGTYVLPDADVKIFLTASLRTRAERRFQDMLEKGYLVTLEEIEEEIRKRDELDSKRDIAPLEQASDAVLIDSTGLSIGQVVERILGICLNYLGTDRKGAE
ncbi:cytidylate kinase [Collibacillus ludicampi]|uniref:Cytidylate kinase n=1 Tax=Collibacillus ludicampi TaxID=2771369 RepID=A0AAV4LK36_9BACL|nr:(d)CMP kinase [Collibacillus ludicampi]GIM48215.1 cytidylate kinase [Collibacillus ludicampi]